MPIYEYECKCGAVEARVLPLKDYDQPQTCRKCSEVMAKVITRPPFGYVQARIHYKCPITNRPITTKQQHEDNLARQNCRVYEPSERETNARRRKEAEQELDKSIETTVEQQFDSMPTEKRERLANELRAGVDTQLVRSTPTGN